MFRIRIVWGIDQDIIETKSFETKKELDAYLLGVADAEGWMESFIFESITEDQPPITIKDNDLRFCKDCQNLFHKDEGGKLKPHWGDYWICNTCKKNY